MLININAVAASEIIIDEFESFLRNLKPLKILDFRICKYIFQKFMGSWAFLKKLMGLAQPIEPIEIRTHSNTTTFEC